MAAEAGEQIVERVPDLAFQEPERVLNIIKSHYQEALYVSKTPLAYFAKGPLSRARACFLQHDGSSRDCSFLIAELRSLILPLPTIDKKYRETIPNLLKELPFSVLSGDDSTSVLASMAGTRKSKKTKLGKNGLHPNEEASIARWWFNKDLSNVACDTTEARAECTRSILLEQRSRETQLQIIIVLETLALEASTSNHRVSHELIEGQRGNDGRVKEKTRKPKDPQNLDHILDLLVDRLSIWQSMATEDTKALPNQQRLASQHENKGPMKANHLQQFCVEVVIPFYRARLPEKIALLCEKLDSTKDPSPKHPPLAKFATGAAISCQRPRKSHKTLERVLTAEKPGSRKQAPSLSRSATEPTLPQMKREVSAKSTSYISPNRVAISKRYSQREVDLRAASQATEAKLKKKATIEHELQGAIAALKKPNPRMAVKELLEAAETRAAGPHSKKPRNSVHNPLGQGVQIMATPSKDRPSQISVGRPRLPRRLETESPERGVIPVPSLSKVLCSTAKAPSSSVRPPKASIGSCADISYDSEQTPTRGPSKFFGQTSSRSGFIKPKPMATARSSGPLLHSMITDLAPGAMNASFEAVAPFSVIHATPSKVHKHIEGISNLPQDSERKIETAPVQNRDLAIISEDTSMRQSTVEPQLVAVPSVYDDELDEL
ncbi:MAG: hypothetical protein Q9217_003801 [Psora testacea]